MRIDSLVISIGNNYCMHHAVTTEPTPTLLDHGPKLNALQTTGSRRLHMTAGVLKKTKRVVGALDRLDPPVPFRCVSESGGILGSGTDDGV